MKTVYVRVICAMLCLVMLASVFSCKKQEETESTASAESDVFALTVENLSQYQIIVAERQQQDLRASATALQADIKEITGAAPKIKSDFVVAGSAEYSESEYEIIIGRADRECVADLYKSLRNKDHGYVMAGTKVVILGETAEVVNRSLALFKQDVLSKATDGGALLCAGENRVNVGSYTRSTMQIDGVDIFEYTIVYPVLGTLQEKRIAEELSNWIKLNTGYSVSCVGDNVEASEYEIQIGRTNRITQEIRADMDAKITSDTKYYLAKDQGTVWTAGRTNGTVTQAVLAFLNAFGEDGSLKLSATVCEELTALPISVMSYNVRGMKDGDKRDPDQVIECILERSPDVFVAQEATSVGDNSAKWITRFKTALLDEYDVVLGFGVGNYGSYQPIYYKKDKFELVSSSCKYLTHTPDKKSMLDGQSQYYRIVNIAVLRDKATGVEFVVSDNHFDISGYIVRTEEAKILAGLLKNYPLLPLIVAGDFNTEVTTSPIDALVGNSRLIPGEKIAAEKIMGGSGAPDFQNRGETIIDLLFVSDSNVTVEKYEIWDNKTSKGYPSDHLPVWVEITVYG